MENISSSSLSKKHCVPCEGGTAPLTEQQEEMYHSAVPDWQVERENIHQLQRELRFKNFVEAMQFVNAIATIAEEQGHHPDIFIFYNTVRLTLYTHAIKGLSENDFIMAARINEVFVKNQPS